MEKCHNDFTAVIKSPSMQWLWRMELGWEHDILTALKLRVNLLLQNHYSSQNWYHYNNVAIRLNKVWSVWKESWGVHTVLGIPLVGAAVHCGRVDLSLLSLWMYDYTAVPFHPQTEQNTSNREATQSQWILQTNILYSNSDDTKLIYSRYSLLPFKHSFIFPRNMILFLKTIKVIHKKPQYSQLKNCKMILNVFCCTWTAAKNHQRTLNLK